MPDSDYNAPTVGDEETLAQFLHRLVHRERLGAEELAKTLQEENLEPSDIIIAAAEEAQKRKQDLTVDVNFDDFREIVEDKDLSDEEIRSFLQGVLDSEGFQTLVMTQATSWFLENEDQFSGD